MSKKKIKLNFKRIFLFLLLPLLFIIIIVCILFSKSLLFKEALSHATDDISIFNTSSKYKVSKIDNNPNYSGIRSRKSTE